MLAGTVIALGGIGEEAGLGNKRGSLVSGRPLEPLPAYAFATRFHPPALRLQLRRARELGLTVDDALLRGTWARWSGDRTELTRGEILIFDEREWQGDEPVDERTRRHARGRDGRRRRRAGDRGPHAGLRRAAGGLRRPGARRAPGRPGLRGRLHGRAGPDRPGAGHRRRTDVAGGRRRRSTIRRRRAWPRSTPAGSSSTTTSSRWPADRGARWRGPRICSTSWPGASSPSEAVLCLETRQEPPAEIVEKVAERCGVEASAVTFLIAPTASVCGSVQISARVVETALHKLHELGVDPGAGAPGLGLLPDRSGGQGRPGRDRADQRRGAVRRHRPPVDRGRRRRGRRPRASGCRRPPRRRSARRSASCSRPPTGTSTTSIRCCSAPPRPR